MCFFLIKEKPCLEQDSKQGIYKIIIGSKSSNGHHEDFP